MYKNNVQDDNCNSGDWFIAESVHGENIVVKITTILCDAGIY